MKESSMGTMIRALLMGGALTAACAHAAQPGPHAPWQIQRAWDDMQRAANAHDTDRFMAPFAHSPDLIFAVNGEIIRGWNALHAQQLKWWHNGKSDAHYTQDGRPDFMALGPGAEVSTASFTSRRTGPDGKARTGRFVVTYVWKKSPQGWRIVYGHESWARPPG
jgi:ketosteroid isomerase-like protein